MAAWGWVWPACHNTDCNWLGGEKQTTSNLPLAYIIYRENHYHYYHSDKRLLAEPPRSSFSVIKEFVPSPQTSFVPTLLVFFSLLGQMCSQKYSPIWLLHGELTTGLDHRMTYYIIIQSNKKNNKQEELATRSWKHRPHSQFCLWSFTFYSILMWCCS